MTPGKTEQPSRAGALPRATGPRRYGLGPRKNKGGGRALWALLATTSPARQRRRIAGVVDNACMHKAKAVEQGWARPPRLAGLWLPTYGPRAHPLERGCGAGHDKCTRHHQRQRLRKLLQAVERHVQEHGPWQYKLSQRSEAPEITAAVEHIAAEQQSKSAACVYESPVG
jgi:hypothetical protein